MKNLFQKHDAKYNKKTNVAKKKIVKKIVDTTKQIFELILGDVRTLKNTAREKRGALKLQFINKYQEMFDKECEKLDWTGNLLIFWNIMWRFDVGDFEDAWQYAKVGFKKGLTVDKSAFERDFATLVAGTILDWAQQFSDDNKQYSTILYELITMIESDGLVINETVHAKLLKLHGLDIINENPRQALIFFEKATQLYPRISLKTKIKELNQQLNN